MIIIIAIENDNDNRNQAHCPGSTMLSNMGSHDQGKVGAAQCLQLRAESALSAEQVRNTSLGPVKSNLQQRAWARWQAVGPESSAAQTGEPVTIATADAPPPVAGDGSAAAAGQPSAAPRRPPAASASSW